MVPVVIEDINRNIYLEALKKYRQEKNVTPLVELLKKNKLFIWKNATILCEKKNKSSIFYLYY